MTALCAVKYLFGKVFTGIKKMFANIKAEQGNLIIHDLNIKSLCIFNFGKIGGSPYPHKDPTKL